MGPLSGTKIVEFAGLGPAPFASMMLSDQGAEVIRIGRPQRPAPRDVGDVLSRGKRSITLNMKSALGLDVARRIIANSDGLIEGFRPGVMEKFGLSPEECAKINPGLVFGRLTGWGQTGPLAKSAGHDLNYIALSGALQSMAPVDGPPQPSPGLVGDFGGGGMFLAFGMVCALLEAQKSGLGQTVDASVCDGSAMLTSLISGWRATGQWQDEAASNIGNGAAPFYNSYRCKDGLDVTIGSIEPQFYGLLLQELNLTNDPLFAHQMDRSRWPEAKQRLTEIFAQRTRAEWCSQLEATDVCFAPVLSLSEAHDHPQNIKNKTFMEIDGVVQPSPAPKFGRTPGLKPGSVPLEGEDTLSLLQDLGLSNSEIEEASGMPFENCRS